MTFRYTDITARDPRGQLNNQWAWAISNDLTLRAHIGGAKEGNDFEALFGGLALNYDFSPQWSASLTGRLYRDTGEIVSAGFNTAASRTQFLRAQCLHRMGRGVDHDPSGCGALRN